MDDEAAFLRAILDNPADDAPRLVYADWLDERGDPQAEAKAALLRDTTSLLTTRGRDRAAVRRRLQRAAPTMDGDWLAVVGKLAVEACAGKFRFRCPKRWERLRATDDVRVRFCDECRKTVRYCDTIEEAQDFAWQGQCVAVSLTIPRRSGDLFYPMLLGGMRPEPSEREMIAEFEADRQGP